MRAQLMGPDNHIVSDQQYNELFTMHGAIMLLLFATPLLIGLANEIMSLQIGAPDVAFPRMNLMSYYFFLNPKFEVPVDRLASWLARAEND